jgi:hypothetical protein
VALKGCFNCLFSVVRIILSYLHDRMEPTTSTRSYVNIFAVADSVHGIEDCWLQGKKYLTSEVPSKGTEAPLKTTKIPSKPAKAPQKGAEIEARFHSACFFDIRGSTWCACSEFLQIVVNS